MDDYQCKNLFPEPHSSGPHSNQDTIRGTQEACISTVSTPVLCSDSHRLTDDISDHPHRPAYAYAKINIPAGIGQTNNSNLREILTVMENPLNVQKEKTWKILASKSFTFVRYLCLSGNKNFHGNRVPWTLVHLWTRPGRLTTANKHLPSFVVMSW